MAQVKKVNGHEIQVNAPEVELETKDPNGNGVGVGSGFGAADCPAAAALRRRPGHHRVDDEYARSAKELGIDEVLVATDSECEEDA